MYLGDNSHLNIVSCGGVKIRFPNGRVREIDGVLHIPSLARYLLSVSKLGDVGVQIFFSSDGCKMTRGSMVLAKGVRMGTLNKLDVCMIQCNSTFVKSKKRVLDSSSSPVDQEKNTIVSTSNGHAFWVPKGAKTL